MEDEYTICAIALLSRLPSEEEDAEVVLKGGQERDTGWKLDLAGLLRGTPMESWTAPGNKQFLGLVVQRAKELLKEGKINSVFSPDEEIKMGGGSEGPRGPGWGKALPIRLMVVHRNRKQRRGALPPLRSPSFKFNTARILSEWSQIQRACRSGAPLRCMSPSLPGAPSKGRKAFRNEGRMRGAPLKKVARTLAFRHRRRCPSPQKKEKKWVTKGLMCG